MKKGDDVYQLIKTLTPSEKRYFKIYAKQHVIGEQNQYEKLFDLIEAQVKENLYDEKIISKYFGDKKNIIHSLKHYLQELLLRSMRSYYENRSVENEIIQLLADAKFLLRKGLYNKCNEAVQSAYKKAEALDMFSRCIELLTIERKLLRQNFDKYTSERLQQIDKQIDTILKQYKNEEEYKSLYDSQFLILQKEYLLVHNKQDEKVNAILAHHLMQNKDTALSKSAIIYYHNIHGGLANLLNDHKSSAKHLKEIIHIFDKHSLVKKEQANRYIDILNNYLNACYLAGDFKLFPAVLKVMKDFKPVSEEQELLLFKNRPYLEMVFLINNDKYTEAKKIIPEIAEGIKKFSNLLPASRIIALQYNCAVTYLLMKDYNQSLDWFNKIVLTKYNDVRIDVQIAARIFQIILHAELDSVEILQSLIRNNIRFFEIQKRYNEFEKCCVEFSKKMLSAITKSEKQEITKQTIVVLKKIIKVQSDNITGILDVLSYLKNKIALPVKN